MTRALSEFGGVWGNKWLSHLEKCDIEKIRNLWVWALAGLTEDQIVNAFKRCCKIYDFPPSINEFLREAYEFVPEEEAFERGCYAIHHQSEFDRSNPRDLMIINAALIARDAIKALPMDEAHRIFINQYRAEIKKFLTR